MLSLQTADGFILHRFMETLEIWNIIVQYIQNIKNAYLHDSKMKFM